MSAWPYALPNVRPATLASGEKTGEKTMSDADTLAIQVAKEMRELVTTIQSEMVESTPAGVVVLTARLHGQLGRLLQRYWFNPDDRRG